jgi:hypothetical protein
MRLVVVSLVLNVRYDTGQRGMKFGKEIQFHEHMSCCVKTRLMTGIVDLRFNAVKKSRVPFFPPPPNPCAIQLRQTPFRGAMLLRRGR